MWAGEFGRTPFAQGSDGRDQPSVGETIVELFLRMSANVQETAQSILASRMVWSQRSIHGWPVDNIIG